MANLNINNIENVEGEYHLKFIEGKKTVEKAKNDLRYAFFSLLLFVALVLIFVLVSGFNLFFAGFLIVYLIVCTVMFVYGFIQKRKGKKDCIYAVQNSKAEDVISKQVDNRGKVITEKTKKKQRKRRRAQIVRVINHKDKKQ